MPIVSRPTSLVQIIVNAVRRCYLQCRRMQRRVNRLH